MPPATLPIDADSPSVGVVVVLSLAGLASHADSATRTNTV
jgi:hypothetical protein